MVTSLKICLHVWQLHMKSRHDSISSKGRHFKSLAPAFLTRITQKTDHHGLALQADRGVVGIYMKHSVPLFWQGRETKV